MDPIWLKRLDELLWKAADNSERSRNELSEIGGKLSRIAEHLARAEAREKEILDLLRFLKSAAWVVGLVLIGIGLKLPG